MQSQAFATVASGIHFDYLKSTLMFYCLMQSQAFATVASCIEAVEAGHAAIIRYQLYQVQAHVSGKSHCSAWLVAIHATLC